MGATGALTAGTRGEADGDAEAEATTAARSGETAGLALAAAARSGDFSGAIQAGGSLVAAGARTPRDAAGTPAASADATMPTACPASRGVAAVFDAEAAKNTKAAIAPSTIAPTATTIGAAPERFTGTPSWVLDNPSTVMGTGRGGAVLLCADAEGCGVIGLAPWIMDADA